ncbi:beta-glucuronidase [Priestia abyssalis]|uniref:beta-glucuronidase n=1 Tax=Priestia abyssalis TaxID=1221450 RepID=UPI0009951391|nr:beta-glucuronidase [Priestia abyssalis]
MLYPQNNLKRELMELNGLWNFKLHDDQGDCNEVPLKKLEDTILMSVPASYNDLSENPKVKNHVGKVWYEREFYIPEHWNGKRIVLRFGSVTHYGKVWINGQYVMEHAGGYTPFEEDISPYVSFDKKNRVTVMVDNILDFTTTPIGKMEGKNLDYYFDFFNYSGIHRPVKIYTTAKDYIQDITIVTDLKQEKGIVHYDIEASGPQTVKVSVVDEEGQVVASSSSGVRGSIEIKNPTLWQPGNAYLYTLLVELINPDGTVVDIYEEEFGIRTVEVRGKDFLINGKPFYFKGFGKHEDTELNGRGFNEVANIKDFSLMKWIGANSFRTAHYPYSEEIMRQADREGIVVIDETAAVGLHINLLGAIMGGADKRTTWEQVQTHESHAQAIRELIKRDKNHPCVVMWSIANEPAGDEEGAYEYFKPLVDLTKELDSTRPVTIVSFQTATPKRDLIYSLIDVFCLNRYYGWYTQSGDLKAAEEALRSELTEWWETDQKPIIITEFGADTMHGMTSTVPVMWTEEFQVEFLKMYHKVFDELDHVIGEHVWNFADFATKEGIIRVGGNKKGVFTRDRKPKKAAYLLHERYNQLPDFIDINK